MDSQTSGALPIAKHTRAAIAKAESGQLTITRAFSQSTQNIFDVADQGKGLQQPIDSLCVGNPGERADSPADSPLPRTAMASPGITLAEGSPALGDGLSSFGSGGGVTAPAISSPPFPIDRFGDDRFADNILRACRNLAQNGDDEEERAAAEEGALIEASGYSDPQHESNGRY